MSLLTSDIRENSLQHIFFVGLWDFQDRVTSALQFFSKTLYIFYSSNCLCSSLQSLFFFGRRAVIFQKHTIDFLNKISANSSRAIFHSFLSNLWLYYKNRFSIIRRVKVWSRQAISSDTKNRYHLHILPEAVCKQMRLE